MKKTLLVLVMMLPFSLVFSQWDSSLSNQNNLVSAIGGVCQAAVTDGNDGLITAWQSSNTLMIQRKTVGGKVKWNTVASPVTVFTGAVGINFLDIISDGKGGAYVSWNNLIDQYTYDVYLQHVSASGDLLFGSGGRKVNSPAITVNTGGKLCLSGDGVIIVWGNEQVDPWGPNPQNSNVFVQRFDALGNPQWAGDMPVSTVLSQKMFPVIVADNNGGAFVCFSDSRNSDKDQAGYYTNFDIYMQHLDSNGQRLWGMQDSILTNEAGSQMTYEAYTSVFYSNSIVQDGAGGFVVVFINADGSALYAQRVHSNGSRAWASATAFIGEYNTKYTLRVIPDGQNGIVATWHTVPPSGRFVYAQRVAADGSLPWASSPLIINSATDWQSLPTPVGIAEDGMGNYVFAWLNDFYTDNVAELKVQKVSPNGSFLWNSNGVVIYNQPEDAMQGMQGPVMVKSTAGNVIATWRMLSGINAVMLQPNGSLYNNAFISFSTVKAGNWNDPSIWDNGMVPAQGTDIIVNHQVIVNTNIVCSSLKVITPGSITVSPGFTIKIIQ